MYSVAIYHAYLDEMVGDRFTVPFLPYPGLVIIRGGGGWKVQEVQVVIPDPGSIIAREGGPLTVDVVAVPCDGVHNP